MCVELTATVSQSVLITKINDFSAMQMNKISLNPFSCFACAIRASVRKDSSADHFVKEIRHQLVAWLMPDRK